MPYLIDGHNLIGALSSAALGDPDDEMRLVQRLHAYFIRLRRQATVIFDRGQPGHRHKWSTGALEVRFAPPSSSADQLILERLRRLPDVHNWTLITSDRRLQDEARRLGARVLASETFAQALRRPRAEPGAKDSGLSNQAEIDYWEELFKKGRDG